MYRQSILAILALALAPGGLAPSATAAAPSSRQVPSPPAVLELAPAGTVVFDDDGGRVQIIPRRPQPAAAGGGEVSYHGGPVVSGGDIRAIFLGSGWRSEMNRARESRALEVLAGRGQEEAMASLARFGLVGQELHALAQEDFLDPLAGGRISDLEIQARLDSLAAVEAGGAAGAGAETPVYVVFLAPGIESALGSSTSAKDFAAYHNHFHSAAGVVRYVVVPFEAQVSRWLASARQSLVQTLINPEGTAWY
ncbi:MAG TPA: hypothetical protein VHQ90_23195 [Thermoanaerobaculia bacterium]|nr:hypothetical protein [Thermoanaerobaculia bacterium]